MKGLVSTCLILCCTLLAAPAVADVADGVNEIRREGCKNHPGVKQRLRSSRGLDEVAREWSRGGRLREALDRTDYRGTSTASMRVEGSTDEKAILGVLRDSYCDTIINPAFTEIGLYQRGDAVWLVVATPFLPPKTRDAKKVSQQVLSLVNDARSKPRKCGRTSHQAVPPLTLSAMLNRAALIHSQDMDKNNLFQHEGSDGSRVGDRTARVGYRWRAVAENIAIGPETAEIVVQGWLDSPGHCVNIMSPDYTEMGIAYVTDLKSKPGIYWTQVFGRPL
ncbi:MAG: CAP domain-containing protein [Steroidobacter sp.]